MAQFFRGNYGSALGRVDTRPIVEAGRAQGQMFANLGGQIGNMIQQYGLNKQKRDEAEAVFQADFGRVMQNPEQLASMQADPVIGPTLKRIQEGKGNMSDFDKYNAFRAADKQAELDTLRTEQIKLQGIAQTLLNEKRRLDNELATGTMGDRKRIVKGQADITQAAGDYAPEQQQADLGSKITRTAATTQAIQQGEEMFPMEMELMGANIDRTRGLTDLTKAQLSLLKRPIDLSIPGNSDNSKILKGLRSDISALRTQKSFTKNDEGEFVSLEDLIEFDVNTGKATISENASKRDEVALRELVKLVESEYATSMNQMITHTFKNGQTVTAPMGDVMRLIKEEKDKELADKMLEDDKLRNLRNTQGLMRMDYNYTNLDPAIAEIMAGPR